MLMLDPGAEWLVNLSDSSAHVCHASGAEAAELFYININDNCEPKITHPRCIFQLSANRESRAPIRRKICILGTIVISINSRLVCFTWVWGRGWTPLARQCRWLGVRAKSWALSVQLKVRTQKATSENEKGKWLSVAPLKHSNTVHPSHIRPARGLCTR